VTTARASGRIDLERALGRLVSAGTSLAVLLLVVGVALMLAEGRSPVDAGLPGFVPGEVLPALLAGRAGGFLAAGLMIAVATPVARVAGALVGALVRGEPMLAAVAAAVLVVLAVGTTLALVGA
jgi:uncharacterized membrane protein